MAQGIEGLNKVMTRLNKATRKLDTRSTKGVLDAVAFIREDMDKTPPVIPVKRGNLRNSWFVNFIKKMNMKLVKMGFSANYAIYVHEMLDDSNSKVAINWNREGSGPKFFQKALERNYDKILEIIAGRTKI